MVEQSAEIRRLVAEIGEQRLHISGMEHAQELLWAKLSDPQIRAENGRRHRADIKKAVMDVHATESHITWLRMLLIDEWGRIQRAAGEARPRADA